MRRPLGGVRQPEGVHITAPLPLSTWTFSLLHSGDLLFKALYELQNNRKSLAWQVVVRQLL